MGLLWQIASRRIWAICAMSIGLGVLCVTTR